LKAEKTIASTHDPSSLLGLDHSSRGEKNCIASVVNSPPHGSNWRQKAITQLSIC